MLFIHKLWLDDCWHEKWNALSYLIITCLQNGSIAGNKTINIISLLIIECLYEMSSDMFHFEMELLSSLWHMKFVFLVWTVGTAEAAGLFMCLEGRPTTPFIRLLLRRGSRQDTPSLMTWTDTNRRAWAGWIWPFIKVQGKRTIIKGSINYYHKTIGNTCNINAVFVHL